MKKLLASLWLSFLIGTAARDLRAGNNINEQTEHEAFGNFHHACNLQGFSHPASSSVHTLMPSDIQAVAAIGSLGNTRASGMHRAGSLQSTQRSLIQASMETLKALVRGFNPSVKLYSSLGNSSAASQIGTTSSLLEEAEEIVSSMKDSRWLDYENDWKLITVLYPCPSQADTSQETFPVDSIKEVEEVLDFLHDEVPRAFVNLVDATVLAMSSDPRMDQNNVRDPALQSCIYSDASRKDDIIRKWTYQDALEKLLESRRYDQKNDFTVVPQTPLQDAERHLMRNGEAIVNSPKRSPVKIPGEEFAALGVELWNKMMEPVGQKKPYPFSEIPMAQCPSLDHPYFFTYRNSNYSSFPMESQTKDVPQELSFGTSIPCTDRSPSDTVPDSVHELRPADIKVIGALGDSLTAANGAGSAPMNVLDVLTQYRGLSWSIGGDKDINTVTTLANILREFNPSLKGFSTGKGTQVKSNARLNQAVAGAHSEDVPAQARRLIDLMKADSEINFEKDWKLVTLFIGGNDLCDSCSDTEQLSPERFVSNIQAALDILQKEVPRVFVNLVTVLHITTLGELYHEKSIFCPRLLMRSLCPCVVKYDLNSPEIEALALINKKYQEGTHHLIESGKYDTREDFTVVVQPFLEGVTMPKNSAGLPDATYFAPDCFHFQQKTHSQAARALWNNMLEPLGEKLNSVALEDEITLKCPSPAQLYLRTYKNSAYTYPTQPPTVFLEDR